MNDHINCRHTFRHAALSAGELRMWERRLRFLHRAVAIAGVMTIGCAVGGLPFGMTRHTAETLGVRFAYPDSLLVGRFADVPLPPGAVAGGMEPPFRNAVVLVRPTDLGDHSLDAIPVGEIPVIWFDRSLAASAVFRMLEPDTSYVIGTLTISRFPGFPGPYGDEAFYFVVEFADGTLVEVAAHRRDMHHPERATHFDDVIEQILPTLELMGM